MSIIIEDTDDIKLLIEFYEQFNFNLLNKKSAEKESSTNVDTMEIEQVIENKFNEMEKQFVSRMNSKMQKHLCIIEETIANKYLANIESENEKNEMKTIRKYRRKYTPFQITGLTKEGKFTQKKGKPFSFDILDCLKLKKLIPKTDEYPTFEMLGKEFEGVYIQSLIRLSYLIEIGEMDKWFNEWEQIQADDFFGNWKAIPTVNNPQKRKENGMV